MHHPHDQARPSIYYPYQVFEPWLPSQYPPAQKHAVVIAGAGPIGLVAALELARHGVASVVLESERQVSEGSRAIVFTRRSMEILQQVGVAHRVTQNGLPWRFGNSFFRGQQVFRMEAPYDTNDRFFPMINLQQQYLEEYLLDAVRANPLIDLRWGNRVLSVTQDANSAQLEVDTSEGPYTLQADWLVAADGARSGIRTAMQLKLEGNSYEGRFVIADIRVDLPLPTERLAFFDPDWNPGNTVLMHREPHGIWRIDYQLPEGETPEQALQPESLRQRIDAQLAMIGHAGVPWQMDWNSVYSARALTLPDYVHGRVLFTGDAAHLLPIFGVRGANTGFQDAQALGWRLAFVVKGVSPASLLQTYSTERVGAAREIIDEAGKSTRFMTPPTRGFRLLRDAVLSLSLTQAFVRPLYHWRTSRPHAYRNSSLNAQGDDDHLFTNGPACGEPPQNVRLGTDDYLLDHLDHGFALLYAVDADAHMNGLPLAILGEIDRARQQGIPIKVLPIGQTPIPDANGQLRKQYGLDTPGAAYLLRPDQHVCARWKNLGAERLRAALQTATAQTETTSGAHA
jgi:3-(3-hydroxy-phenyl)propionate hydroxylase